MSPSLITPLFQEGQNINIKNIELKYVNPTYVVQYNGSSENGPDVPRHSRPRSDRKFSLLALESHLGHRPTVVLEGDTPERQERMKKMTMHYEEGADHVIGVGPETDRLMNEKQKEEHDREEEIKKSIRDWSSANLSIRMTDKEVKRVLSRMKQKANRRLSLGTVGRAEKNVRDSAVAEGETEESVFNWTEPSKEKEVKTRWPADIREPLGVMSEHSVKTESERITQTRSSRCKEEKCRKLKVFVKKCLCLSTEEGSDGAEHKGLPKKGVREKRPKKRPKSQPNKKLPVVRITESEFAKTDEGKREPTV